MQLYILDKDPIKSAQLIPDKYKFKMLIELGQLICSAGLSDVYKPIPQGKELQQWVKIYPFWTYKYACQLLMWSEGSVKIKKDTVDRLFKIIFDDLWGYSLNNKENIIPVYAYFRYSSNYKCNIPSKTLLPINECIEQYKKYLHWKLDKTT